MRGQAAGRSAALGARECCAFLQAVSSRDLARRRRRALRRRRVRARRVAGQREAPRVRLTLHGLGGHHGQAGLSSGVAQGGLPGVRRLQSQSESVQEPTALDGPARPPPRGPPPPFQSLRPRSTSRVTLSCGRPQARRLRDFHAASRHARLLHWTHTRALVRLTRAIQRWPARPSHAPQRPAWGRSGSWGSSACSGWCRR